MLGGHGYEKFGVLRGERMLSNVCGPSGAFSGRLTGAENTDSHGLTKKNWFCKSKSIVALLLF